MGPAEYRNHNTGLVWPNEAGLFIIPGGSRIEFAELEPLDIENLRLEESPTRINAPTGDHVHARQDAGERKIMVDQASQSPQHTKQPNADSVSVLQGHNQLPSRSSSKMRGDAAETVTPLPGSRVQHIDDTDEIIIIDRDSPEVLVQSGRNVSSGFNQVPEVPNSEIEQPGSEQEQLEVTQFDQTDESVSEPSNQGTRKRYTLVETQNLIDKWLNNWSPGEIAGAICPTRDRMSISNRIRYLKSKGVLYFGENDTRAVNWNAL
ncbi:hypothetical protein N0V90_002818 [Kalmusia sp. IMI 367209]|nr:hypothetical protein N0V90_002818 [Kalmusia sp. IMI 367209]